MEGDSEGISHFRPINPHAHAPPAAVDSIWGVIDFVPRTDFPDIRAMAYVHSHEGTLFVIPRERDLVRLYIQQSADALREFVDPDTRRVNKSRCSPEKLLEQGRKILHPYKVEIQDGRVDWWTIYAGESLDAVRNTAILRCTH